MMVTRLRDLRRRANMTLEQAAEAFGLSLSGYWRLEKGHRRLTEAHIKKACDVFGADVREVPTDLAKDEAQETAARTRSGAADPAPLQIDPDLLATLIAAARSRLNDLDEADARNLVQALIEAARKR